MYRRREIVLRSSHYENKVEVDWLVKYNNKYDVSVMEAKPTTTSQTELAHDFVKLVKEGVDISNHNLDWLGYEIVYPLIQATGKSFIG